jgi:tRNA threonylcarbamoyladenosine biosynthesis protein TsaB
MLAQAALQESPTATVLAAVDARMGEVYFGCYRGENGIARLLGAERVCPPQSVPVFITRSSNVIPAEAGFQLSSGAPVPELDSRLRGNDEIAEWVGIGTGWGDHGNALQQAVGGTASRIDPTALPRAADGLRLLAADFGHHAIDAVALIPAYLRNNVALTKLEQTAAREAARKPSHSV